jgi:hypothetical protein
MRSVRTSSVDVCSAYRDHYLGAIGYSKVPEGPWRKSPGTTNSTQVFAGRLRGRVRSPPYSHQLAGARSDQRESGYPPAGGPRVADQFIRTLSGAGLKNGRRTPVLCRLEATFSYRESWKTQGIVGREAHGRGLRATSTVADFSPLVTLMHQNWRSGRLAVSLDQRC